MIQKKMSQSNFASNWAENIDRTMFQPFIISLLGVTTDYITTCVGLTLGFYETHAQYHPALALLIFWGALILLTVTLPKEKPWHLSKNLLASASFLGTINNTLVLLGVFSGLII